MNRIYTKTIPRKWTEEDILKLKELKEKKLSNSLIALTMNRSEVSIQIKLKRLNKNNNTYNKKHIEEKRQVNKEFIKEIKPKTILDLYAGETTQYEEYQVTTNDKNRMFKCDYNEDALKLLCKLYASKKKYDYIDLDPFGSAYECFDLAIKMAKKGIAITIGEMGHKRWKRFDFVKNRYNITQLKDFTTYNIVKEIQKIGLANHKELHIYKICEWQNISRVWFKIKPIKITEQWERKNKPQQMVLF